MLNSKDDICLLNKPLDSLDRDGNKKAPSVARG